MNDKTEILPHIRLKFNIDNPSLEDCWAEGYESGQAEVTEKENPHEKDTPEFLQWREGWWAGFYGEEPIYELVARHQTNDLAPTIRGITREEAANEPLWKNEDLRKWTGRVVKIAGAIAATAVVGYTLVEMAG